MFAGIARCALLSTGTLLFLFGGSLTAGETVAYRGATLETLGEQGRLSGATLIVEDGKIHSVGENVTIPETARVIDVTGKTILPGVVDPYYVFGSRRARAETSRNFGRGGGRRGRGTGNQPVTGGSFQRVEDFFHPGTTDFKPSYRSGITTANLVREGFGQSAFATLDPEADPRKMIDDGQGLLFAAITNQTSSLDLLRTGLDSSQTPSTGSSSRGGGGRRGRGGFGGRGGGGFGRGGSSGGGSTQATIGLLETLWDDVRDGKSPALLNTNNAATILHVLEALEPYERARVALVTSGPNVYELLDQVKAYGITLILQPTLDEVPYSSKRMNIAKMALDLEIPFVLSLSLNQTQLQGLQDDPFFAVAMLVKNGLPRDHALKALTLEPARLLGLDESLGSLEKGKKANLLIFDGDPLATGTRLERVVVDGSSTHEN